MTEAILFLVIVTLTSLIGWMDYNNRKERKSYLNALIAKNAEEAVSLELASNTKIEAKKEEQPDIVPLDSLSDEEFLETIQN